MEEYRDIVLRESPEADDDDASDPLHGQRLAVVLGVAIPLIVIILLATAGLVTYFALKERRNGKAKSYLAEKNVEKDPDVEEAEKNAAAGIKEVQPTKF